MMNRNSILVALILILNVSTLPARHERRLAAPPLLTDTPKIETETTQRKQRLSLGLELGTVGIYDNANYDPFGLRLLYGGRAVLGVPIDPHFSFRPSLGYFRRSEGTDEAGILTHLIEASAGIQWSPWPHNSLRPLIGFQLRGDFYMGQIFTLSSSVVSPTLLRLRMGPTLGGAWTIDKNFVLILETEGGIRTHEPVRGYGALHLGFSYLLD